MMSYHGGYRAVYIAISLLFGIWVTGTEELPKEIRVKCGTETCNILEEYCTLDGRCEFCNKDLCALSNAPGERPPQCFFKCDNVMQKLQNYSTDGFPAWSVYFLLILCIALVISMLLLVSWMVKTKKKCCAGREMQQPLEESGLGSDPNVDTSERPTEGLISEPSRRSPIITSPQNDR